MRERENEDLRNRQMKSCLQVLFFIFLPPLTSYELQLIPH